MLHFGWFEIRTDIFVLLLAMILALLQVFLCFKAKKKVVRLLPVYLSLGLMMVFGVLGFIFDAWDSFGFFFLAMCAALLLVGCVMGWGIWMIVKKLKQGSFENEQ